MNKQTVDYTDELIDVLFKEYNLPGICLLFPQVEVWGIVGIGIYNLRKTHTGCLCSKLPCL